MDDERKQKLMRYKTDKAVADTVIIPVGEEFLEGTEKAIDRLEELFENGYRIEDLDILLEHLKSIGGLRDYFDGLQKSLESMVIPETLKVEGLDKLTKAIDALNKAEKLEKSITKLNTTFDSIHKAVIQDIYARYDYANSAMGSAGQYIGYLSQDGNWFIQRIGTNASGDKSSTYAAGSDAYKKNWDLREKLKYVTRDKVIIQ